MLRVCPTVSSNEKTYYFKFHRGIFDKMPPNNFIQPFNLLILVSSMYTVYLVKRTVNSRTNTKPVRGYLDTIQQLLQPVSC